MKQFWTCPICHSNLDFGEKCDCDKEKEKGQEFFRRHLKTEPEAGQLAFVLDRREGIIST